MRLRALSLGLIGVLLATSSRLVAQGSGQQGTTPAPTVIMGHVTDTLDNPLDGAVVEIAGWHDSLSTLNVRTGSDGAFIVPVIKPGGPYTIVGRAIGFAPVSFTRTVMQRGDTLRIALRLVRIPPELETVTVRGEKGSAMTKRTITAADFNPRNNYDALSVLARYRPGMLGDKQRCPPLGNQPVLDKIYVNGVRRDVPGYYSRDSIWQTVPLPRDASVSPAVVDVLTRIPAGDIDEIRYADCWDRTLPIDRQNALYVTLKPGRKYR